MSCEENNSDTKWDDISALSRCAGIEYPTLIQSELRETVEKLVCAAADEPVEEPLFHLLVPLRFVAGRLRSACDFQFVVGKGRLGNGGIGVRVEFRRDDERGYVFMISQMNTH